MNTEIDFTTFLLSVSSAALVGLGVPAPGTQEKPRINLDLARQNISILELMRSKTQGNRTPEEDRLLEHLLFEVRMRFVEASRQAGSASTPS